MPCEFDLNWSRLLFDVAGAFLSKLRQGKKCFVSFLVTAQLLPVLNGPETRKTGTPRSPRRIKGTKVASLFYPDVIIMTIDPPWCFWCSILTFF